MNLGPALICRLELLVLKALDGWLQASGVWSFGVNYFVIGFRDSGLGFRV